MRESTSERLGGTDLLFALLRAVVVGGGVGWLYLTPLSFEVKERLIILLAGFTGYSVLLYIALYLWPMQHRFLYVLAVLLDLGLLALLVRMTGGIRSDFFLGFYLPAAVYAFYGGLTRGIVLSVCASIIYLTGIGRVGLASVHGADLLLRLGFLLLVTVAAGSLAEWRRRDFENIERLNSDLAVERDRLAKAYTDLQEMQAQILRSEQLAVIGRLAAGIAHEVNNPVASIATCVEGLERRLKGRPKRLPEELTDLPAYLDVMKKAAYRCKEITGKLLTFSQRGDSDLAEEVDLNETVEETIGLIAYQAKQEGVQIDTVADPHLPEVLGNRTALGQVCLNLFINAMDAMSEGGTLSVTTRYHGENGEEGKQQNGKKEDSSMHRFANSGGKEVVGGQRPSIPDATGWVELVVVDTGVGMSEEVQARIFEPFFTTKPVGKGTGLGLTICDQIIRKWGGTITVESQPGCGSTITVLLPVTHDVGEG